MRVTRQCYWCGDQISLLSDGRFVTHRLRDGSICDGSSNAPRASDEELRAELNRRASIRSRPPDPLTARSSPPRGDDFAILRDLIVDATAEAAKTGRWPKDFRYYVYEAAMVSIYGPSFWEWYNVVSWDGE